MLFLKLFVPAILLVMAVPALSQNFQRVQPDFSSVPNHYTQFEWVDADGDKDLDVLAFYRDYQSSFIKLYENKSQIFTEISSPFGTDENPVPNSYSLGDYDLDGDVDILLLDQGTLRIGRNNSNLSFTMEAVPGIEELQEEAHWVDVDADGDLDIVLPQMSNTSIYLRENGLYVPGFHALPPDVRNVSWADVNNDGLMDFIATKGQTSSNPVFLYVNKGDASFQPNGAALVSTAYDLARVRWVDIDGDQDVDFFLSDSEGKANLFKNTITETSVTAFVPSYSFKDINYPRVALGDINQDGLPDIVLNGQFSSDEKTILYLNQSGKDSFSFTQQDLGIQAVGNDLDLIDLDDDDDLDLFFSGYEDFTYVARFEFYLNSGVANPAPRPSAPSGLVSQIGDDVMLRWNKTDAAGSFHYNIEVKRNNQLMVSSLSHRDGSLLLSQSAGKIWKSGTLLRNLPAGMYTWRVQVVDAGGRTSDFSVSQTFTIAAPPASLTLQHPELTKVILQWTDNAADDTGFAVFRKVTNGTTEKMAILPANTTTFTDHNLQTNQYYEYVVKTERSGSLSAPSNAVTVYTSQFEELPFLESTVSLNGIAADMDNDNDYDLLLRGASLLLKNNGDGTSYTSSGLLTAAPDQQFLVRDIDNDGDQDICTVIGDSFAYKVAFFKNENGTFTKVFETPSFQYITQLALEDFNHDGLVDLLYSHSTGGSYSGSYAYMLLYQQSPFSFTDSRFPFVPEQSPFIGIFSVGDLDNDGFADVFSVEKNTEKFNYSRALKVTVLPA